MTLPKKSKAADIKLTPAAFELDAVTLFLSAFGFDNDEMRAQRRTLTLKPCAHRPASRGGDRLMVMNRCGEVCGFHFSLRLFFTRSLHNSFFIPSGSIEISGLSAMLSFYFFENGFRGELLISYAEFYGDGLSYANSQLRPVGLGKLEPAFEE